MKKLIFVAMLCLTGCMDKEFRDRYVVQQIEFERDCPASKIKIIDEYVNRSGDSTYKVDVCGHKMIYKQISTAGYTFSHEIVKE